MPLFQTRSPIFIWLIGVTCVVSINAKERTVVTREDFVREVVAANPGDVIRIAAESPFPGGLEIRGIHGTSTAPIRIVAANPKSLPVIDGGGSGIHIAECSYVTIDGLRIQGARGNGINVDEGGSDKATSKGIVLRNVIVTDIGPSGNSDCIKLSGLDDFVVEHCRVERWGSGGSAIDMVGCHDGRVSHCVFERDPNEAKGQQQANGVQMKGGSARIAVQRCSFRYAGGRGVNIGGSTGAEYFRPLKAKYEAKEIVVEDCEFIGGMSAVAFVGADHGVVRYNTIYHPGRWCMRILQENRTDEMVPSRSGEFTNNIVVFRAREMVDAANIGDRTDPQSFQMRGNVWHCEDDPKQTRRRIRFPTVEIDGQYGVDPDFVDAPTNLSLRAESTVRHAGVRDRTR